MALVWRCDLCQHESDEAMPRGLVWANGLSIPAAERGEMCRSSLRSPTHRIDVCWDCYVDMLDQPGVRRRGDKRLGGYPRCFCGKHSRGVVRIYLGRMLWAEYTISRNLCRLHMEPFLLVGRTCDLNEGQAGKRRDDRTKIAPLVAEG